MQGQQSCCVVYWHGLVSFCHACGEGRRSLRFVSFGLASLSCQRRHVTTLSPPSSEAKHITKHNIFDATLEREHPMIEEKINHNMVNYMALTRALVILPKISGVLSIIGSGLLARHVAKKGLKEVSLTSHMLLHISIVDIISSFFAYFLSSWLAPKGSMPYAAGNMATCTFQGAVFVFSLIYFATAYAELAAIYWLMVQPGWAQSKMKRKGIRYGFTLPPVLIGLCAAIPPIFFGFYNPTLFNCFLNDRTPDSCDGNPEVACTRGDQADYAQIAVFSYVLLGNLVLVVFICLLVYAVYKQEKKSDQYLSKGQAKNRKNTINTAWQGVRYSSAYFLTYFMSYVILGYDVIGDDGRNISTAGEYTLEFFYVILTPLMGFFNAGVYFYPRYSAKRQQNPELNKMSCLCLVLGFEGLGERLCNRRRGKTGTSTPDARSGSAEEKEEERPDEDLMAMIDAA
eukprot:scaffold3867_cov115-Skeletonema_dohrnii-CCMP3373.AAC.8